MWRSVRLTHPMPHWGAFRRWAEAVREGLLEGIWFREGLLEGMPVRRGALGGCLSVRGTLRDSESVKVPLTDRQWGRGRWRFFVLLRESPPNGAGRTGDHLCSDWPHLRLSAAGLSRAET
ncbi:hypothetical protein GCM10009565_21950 [Amycolatopsis albidoflavus]